MIDEMSTVKDRAVKNGIQQVYSVLRVSYFMDAGFHLINNPPDRCPWDIPALQCP